MLLAVISDIHSNLEALERVFEKIEELGIGRKNVFCLGDIIGYGPRPKECVRFLQERGIECLRGNHEDGCLRDDYSSFNPFAAQALRWSCSQLGDEEKTFLSSLPERIERVVDGKRILMVHGSPWDNVWGYVFEGDIDEKFIERVKTYEIVVMGHTHVPFVVKREGKLIVNCGSVGQPRDGDARASFAIVDTGRMDARIVRVSYDVEKVCDEILEKGLPAFLAERLLRGV